MSAERLVRHTKSELLSPLKLLAIDAIEAVRTGGISLGTRASEEHIEEVESRGFDRETVQGYLDRLECNGRETDAAMLRGAFNDLLDQVDM
jgi:hypothetical protein